MSEKSRGRYTAKNERNASSKALAQRFSSHPIPGPCPDEAVYPLWHSLPTSNTLTRAELSVRVDACPSVRQKPTDRSAAQQRNLTTIVDMIPIPESSLVGHMNWATWHFQDVVFSRLNGRNPFGNDKVRYRGSADDALNTNVARYTADPTEMANFSADTDLQGRIPVPVLTLYGISNGAAFVELESTLARLSSAIVGQQSADALKVRI